MSNINLVLSGGGARGIAHLGVVKALQERKIRIERISGASAGSIMGAFIAAGYPPEDTLKIICEQRLFSLIRPTFNRGIFTMNGLEKGLHKYFQNMTFESLDIPLIIWTTCVQTGLSETFQKGDIIKPIIASSSIPGLFEPMVLNGKQYIDGGVINNLPIEPFLELSEPIVAVHVNPPYISGPLNSTMKLVSRVAEVIAYQSIEKRQHHVALFIEPPQLKMFAISDLKRAKEIFKVGYDYALSLEKELNLLKHMV